MKNSQTKLDPETQDFLERHREAARAVTPERWAEVREIARQNLAEMTPEEDRAITESALADPDNPPLDDAFFARKGRPPLDNPKERVTIRLDVDVVSELRASGPGWQTRANAMLRKAVGLK